MVAPTLRAVILYTPVVAPIVDVIFVLVPAEKVQEVVTSVPPTKTLNVPPAPVKSETDPELSAATTWEAFVKKPVMASDPS